MFFKLEISRSLCQPCIYWAVGLNNTWKMWHNPGLLFSFFLPWCGSSFPDGCVFGTMTQVGAHCSVSTLGHNSLIAWREPRGTGPRTFALVSLSMSFDLFTLHFVNGEFEITGLWWKDITQSQLEEMHRASYGERAWGFHAPGTQLAPVSTCHQGVFSFNSALQWMWSGISLWFYFAYPADEWCQAPSHVRIGNLYIFLCEVTIQGIRPFYFTF